MKKLIALSVLLVSCDSRAPLTPEARFAEEAKCVSIGLVPSHIYGSNFHRGALVVECVEPRNVTTSNISVESK